MATHRIRMHASAFLRAQSMLCERVEASAGSCRHRVAMRPRTLLRRRTMLAKEYVQNARAACLCAACISARVHAWAWACMHMLIAHASSCLHASVRVRARVRVSM
eukprot:5398139-Pleurochrysis_carterae.AAC.4